MQDSVVKNFGRISFSAGDTVIVRADGSRISATVGDPIYPGDFIEGLSEGGVRIEFADGTVLSLSEGGRAVLDEAIYDPATHEGSIKVNLLEGEIVVSTGKLGAGENGSVLVTGGAGTIIVNNAHLAARLGDSGALDVVMLGEVESGQSGIRVISESGNWVLDQPLHSVTINPEGASLEGVHWIKGVVAEESYARVLEIARTVSPVSEKETPTNFESPTTSSTNSEATEFETAIGESSSGDTEFESASADTEPDVIEFETAAGDTDTEAPEFESAPGDSTGGDIEQSDVAAPPQTIEDIEPYEPVAIVPPSLVAETPSDSDVPSSPDEGRDDEQVALPEVPPEDPPEDPPEVPNSLPVALERDLATNEDIALGGLLAASDPDSDELTFSLSAEGAPANGTVIINPDGSYLYTPDRNYSGSDSFSFEVTDESGATSTANVRIDVAPVADAPDVNMDDVVGDEDSAIPLNVHASLADSGEEIAFVSIERVPAGATLSAGTDNGDGTWTLAPEDIDGLTIIPPQNSSGDFDLDIRVLSQEPDTLETAETISTGRVTVNAVADMPILSVGDTEIPGGGSDGKDKLVGSEGSDVLVGGGDRDSLRGGGGDDVLIGDWGPESGWPATVQLDIQASLVDVDTSENLSIVISGLPPGAILSAGTDNGEGTWTLAASDIPGLTLLVPAAAPSNFVLDVEARATDVDPDSGAIDTAGSTGTLAVTRVAVSEDKDTIRGGDGDDIAYGGGGDDKLYGDKGDDRLYGDAGDDVLRGGDGADELHGGVGDDRLYGDDDDDFLVGEAGDDYIKAGHGDDVVHGGEGADRLYGDVGDDSLLGGGGDDMIKAGKGDDLVEGGAGDDRLYGDTGDDVVRGDGGDDYITGGKGDDVLEGGTGMDELRGDAGEDYLAGGAGDDTLSGGSGEDTLQGGGGDDLLTGGSGGDEFLFTPGTQDGSDRVSDFKSGDVLRLEGGEFNLDDLEITQSGDETVITIGGHDVEITLDNVDADKLASYQITPEPDSDVIICYEDEVPG